ncbi:MAG TPA: sigma 54-interacting transcriptional regulator, partial [Polyangiaceae bacterium]|nr:sigma 54-interacting transcriptional regulator [Polyangiaceae bacterium]
PGLVGEANESTLFLDELSELPASMQGHLLRVLDGGEYHRLGESVARRSSMRLVAATSRPASELKHDLLARFAYRIDVPELAARREDIPLLASHLVRSLAASDPALRTALGGGERSAPMEVSLGLCVQLLTLPYAGNVRELERLLLKTFVQGGGLELRNVDALETDGRGDTEPPCPEHALSARPAAGAASAASAPAELRPEHIQAVLDQHNGRIEKAYRALGLKNRFALGRLIAKHGLEVRRKRS